MDYKELNGLMDQVVDIAKRVKAECVKDTPDEIQIMTLADEDLSDLKARIDDVLFRDCGYPHPYRREVTFVGQ